MEVAGGNIYYVKRGSEKKGDAEKQAKTSKQASKQTNKQMTHHQLSVCSSLFFFPLLAADTSFNLLPLTSVTHFFYFFFFLGIALAWGLQKCRR
jgi:hypothetical protein